MELKKYQEVISYLKSKRRPKHLLLGNGFSISYDKDIFSYNALSDFVAKSKDPLLQKLFHIVDTTNFELVVSQLDVFFQLATEFLNDQKLSKKILAARDALKTNLVDAISALHPEQVFKIPEAKSKKCATFLKEFLDNEGHVFSANYDLLLYWVLMSNQELINNIVDGFGRERIEGEGEKPQYGDLECGPNRDEQRVHYLHGALHLFDTGVSILKETYDGEYLLENIKKRIENKEYPLFVTAGNGRQKLEHIFHNQYLDYCYKQLCEISGSLITFGFNFGEYDDHIIEAINKASKQDLDKKLWSVYVGVYSDADKAHVEKIRSKFKVKVNLFDAKSVNIWG